MIFKSQQVNLDPEPWADDRGNRCSEPFGHAHFDPRPEFEPTRDPHPWFDPEEERRHPTFRAERNRILWMIEGGFQWAPRRDQFDTPVNPILVDFRDFNCIADLWLEYLDSPEVSDEPWTPEQIDHARKVLTRLAALQQLSDTTS